MRSLYIKTPQTLDEAIQNGLDDIFGQMRREGLSQRDVLYAHVRDFLNQKFTIAVLKSEASGDELFTLLERISRKDAA